MTTQLNDSMSSISTLEVRGLRGFADTQLVRFAEPTGDSGSGLTVVVGANNAGKSTVLEAIRAFAQPTSPPSFSQGRRNTAAGDQVRITLQDRAGGVRSLRSRAAGGSETVFEPSQPPSSFPNIFSLASRRAFNPYFSGNGRGFDRDIYTNSHHMALGTTRQTTVSGFESRLFRAVQNRDTVAPGAGYGDFLYGTDAYGGSAASEIDWRDE